MLEGLSGCKLLSRRRFLRHLQYNEHESWLQMLWDEHSLISTSQEAPGSPGSSLSMWLPSLWISVFSLDLEACSDESDGNLTFALKVGKNGDYNTCTVEKGKKAGNGYFSSFKWTIHLYSEIGEILSIKKGDNFSPSWNLRRINSGLNCLYLFAPSD